jgi:hypothetical protein
MTSSSLHYVMMLTAAFALHALADAAAAERRINTWLVCGTFPCKDDNQFAEDLIGAANLSPAPGQETAGKRWLVCDDRLYCRNLDDYVDLYTFFSPVRQGSPGEQTDLSAAYAHVYVWSPTAQPAQLLLGANDGYQVWMNGQLLRSVPDTMRTAVRDGDRIELMLGAGWNRILFKIQNGRGIWGFYAKLTDPLGENLAGVEYSVSPSEGALKVVTDALPTGYTDTPYLWLEVAGTAPTTSPRVPSASPFRLSATGGKPPYRWKLGTAHRMPPGL